MKRLLTAAARGYTTADVAGLLRVGEDRVRRWIARGELAAVSTADKGRRPRFIVLPEQLAEFVRRRQVAPPPPPKPARRMKRRHIVDYYPD
jgi:excisionase family DNA binding protein